VYSPAGSVPPPSHLTYCTPIKCNLYFHISLQTVIKEPTVYKTAYSLYSESHIHIPSLGPFIRRIRPGPRLCLIFHSKFIVYGEGLLAPRPTPKLENHPCRLSTTAYSIYSQLPSTAGGRSSIRNPWTRHAVMTGPPNMDMHTEAKNNSNVVEINQKNYSPIQFLSTKSHSTPNKENGN
jgi:hypothetical protein